MSGPPQVIYSHLKYQWATGAREETLAFLRDFTARLSADLGIHPDGEHAANADVVNSGRKAEYTRLLARCHYKLGEWQSAMQEDWGSVRPFSSLPRRLPLTSSWSGRTSSPTSFARTSSLPASTRRGTKPGTLGLWPIRRWSRTSPVRKASSKIRISRKPTRSISSRRYKVSHPLCSPLVPKRC